MTPERLRAVILATGRERRELARLLGYGSENSLRQAEAGKQALPAAKALWLEGYAQLRAHLMELEAEWLKRNPLPVKKAS
jgi:transcriptional regulator with XRE-family HTH domain